VGLQIYGFFYFLQKNNFALMLKHLCSWYNIC